MTLEICYSSMENFEQLLDASQAWTQVYQSLQTSPYIESWELGLLEDLIQSEKVFDI